MKVEFTCRECGFHALVDEPGFVAQEQWIRCPRCEAAQFDGEPAVPAENRPTAADA